MVPATDKNKNLENEWLEILMHLPIKRTCIQSDKEEKYEKIFPFPVIVLFTEAPQIKRRVD